MRGIGFHGSAGTALPVRSSVVLCIGAIAVLAVAACSSSSIGSGSNSSPNTASAAAALPEPCSLITQAEVETALGNGATMTAAFNSRIGVHQCHVKRAGVGAMGEIIIVVHPADSWDAIKKAMLPPSSDAKAVSGLGDDAFVGRAIGYNVRKGRKYVQVFGEVTNNDAANEKATRYLAERASSRL
jgi:hypothetical protein